MQIHINIQFGMVQNGKTIVSISMDMIVISMHKIQTPIIGKFFMINHGLGTLELNISIIILGMVLGSSIIMKIISIGSGMNLPKIGLINIDFMPTSMDIHIILHMFGTLNKKIGLNIMDNNMIQKLNGCIMILGMKHIIFMIQLHITLGIGMTLKVNGLTLPLSILTIMTIKKVVMMFILHMFGISRKMIGMLIGDKAIQVMLNGDGMIGPIIHGQFMIQQPIQHIYMISIQIHGWTIGHIMKHIMEIPIIIIIKLIHYGI